MAYDKFSDDEYAIWYVSDFRRRHRWPFDVFVFPIFKGNASTGNVGAAGAAGAAAQAVEKPTCIDVARRLPPDSVAWYIYVGVTHAYCDGATGQVLVGDLLRLYAEEEASGPSGGGNVQQTAPPEHLALLQRRLRQSLHGRLPGQIDADHDVYHEIICEDWGKRRGLQRRVFLEKDVMGALYVAASDVVGCGIDVAWLTVIMTALYRLFPSEPRFQLILKAACRDGPGESEMVGFLSEQRTLPVDVGDLQRATLLHVASTIDSARRVRAWRAPVPFEAGLCVYVNIVSTVHGLQLGCKQVVREASVGQGGGTDAYCHVNLRLDQKGPQDWDFRIFHWDAAWGWHWGTYFASAIGAAILDLAQKPTAPILPPAAPLDPGIGGGTPKRELAQADSDEARQARRRRVA